MLRSSRPLTSLLAFGLLSLLAATEADAMRPSPSPCPREVWTQQIQLARVSLLKNDATAVGQFLGWVSGRTDLPDLEPRTIALGADPRLTAGQTDRSDLLDLGARTLADVGAACGACHSRSGVHPGFSPQGQATEAGTPAPPEGATVQGHMLRHQWAMDRLWEGVIGPSDGQWGAGVAALHDHQTEQLQARERGNTPTETMDWWIHQPGRDAAMTATGVDRSQLYGDLLTACAACHASTKGAPAPATGP